jgi:UbiD family decarboxylase
VALSDLRSWIDLLRREGELAEVEAEVDPYLEITEIVDRTVKSGGPALLFSNVKSRAWTPWGASSRTYSRCSRLRASSKR